MLGNVLGRFETPPRSPKNEVEKQEKLIAASQLIFDRASTSSSKTQTGPTEAMCLAALQDLRQAGGGIPQRDIDRMWYSPRFSFRPPLTTSDLERHVQQERDMYADVVNRYGDTEAQKLLPSILKWQQRLYEETGQFGARLQLEPDFFVEPELALMWLKRKKIKDRNGQPPTRALQAQWRLDIITRAFQGEWDREQLLRIWHDCIAYQEIIQKRYGHTTPLPPMIQGIRRYDEFAARYQSTEST